MYWSFNHGVMYIVGTASGSLSVGDSSLDLLFNHIERAYGFGFSQGHGGDRGFQNKRASLIHSFNGAEILQKY